MSNKHINILVPGGTGGTFLNWSIQFLSNINNECVIITDDQTYSIGKIPNNPLSIKDSHNFKKIHPRVHTFGIYFDSAERMLNNKLITYYTVDAMLDDSIITRYNELISAYQNVTHILFKFDIKHIDYVYSMQARILSKVLPKDIWTHRELAMLSYHKMIYNQLLSENASELASKFSNVIALDFDKYLFSMQDNIRHLMSSLELDIIEERYKQWCDVYNNWQKIIDIKFFEELPKIVDNIVNGISMDLTKYNITYGKECVIFKQLLFNYNMCLQADGIIHMPNNTYEWHALLEPNIYHNIEN